MERRRSRLLPWLSVLLALAVLPALPALGAEPSPSIDPAPSVSPSGSPSPAVSTPPITPTDALPRGVPLAWKRLEVSGGPAPREDHTLTVDDSGEAAWLFGGRDGERAFGDLWRLDLAGPAWRKVVPDGARPADRFGHTATWVPGVGVVIFGGQAGSDFFDDLWAFDAGTLRWRRLSGDGARPAARYGTCAALGPDGRLWISHGFTGGGRFDDTRAYSFEAGRWADMTPSGRGPVIRCLHDCLWTPDDRFLLYGGQTNGEPALGDLWRLATDRDDWTEVPDPAPRARRLYALTSDGGVAYLFGGADRDDDPLDDLWSLDLVTLAWSRPEIAPGPGPAARSGATLIADHARGRLLLVAGEGMRSRLADVWQLAAAVPDVPTEPLPSAPHASPPATGVPAASAAASDLAATGAARG